MATDYASSVALDTTGDVYVAGGTTSFRNGDTDVLITKYAPTGQLLWARTWGGSGNDFATAIKSGPDGYVYVTGGTDGYGAGWYDGFLMKLDATGNVVWANTWGGGSYDVLHDIGFDSLGNIFVVGETYSFSTAAVLLKFSPNGNILWQASYKGPATYDSGYSLTVDSNFNVVVAGISWDYSFNPLHNSILLLKYDSNGNLIWQENWSTSFPGQDESWNFHGLTTDDLGNIYVGGRHSIQCLNSNFSQCDFDALLLKVDSSGSFQWARTWGSSGYDSAGSAILDRQGDIRVSGMEDVFGTPSPFIFSYDASGNVLSETGWSGGNSSNASLGAMDFDSRGNGFLVGSAENNQGEWTTKSDTVTVLNNSLIANSYSTGNPSFTVSAVSTLTQLQTGVQDTGGGGSDLFVARYTGALVFPVKYNRSHCNGVAGICSPSTANVSSIFDHQMGTAYESSEDPKNNCSKLSNPPPMWGTIMDFEGETANAQPTKGSFGICRDLYGYTTQTGATFLGGYNLLSPTYLFYDGHPGYDYPFPFTSTTQTGLFPAINGCVTYKTPAAGASAAGFHVLTIIPQAKKPTSCVGIHSDAGYTVAYLHLSSWLASDGTIQRCLSTTADHQCVTTVPCPTCAQEGDWVDIFASSPIAYVGDFDHGQWHSVGPHLHFEVDVWVQGAPVPIDPYGWAPLTSGQIDPYSLLHPGITNTRLWK